MTTGHPLRAPVGLLHRRGVPAVDPDALHDVAVRVLPGLCGGRLRVHLDDDRIEGPVLVTDDDERSSRTPLHTLAEDLTDAGVAPTPAELAAALRAWLEGRPVSDADAATAGVAVLHWTDPRRVAVGWWVAVRRGDRAALWAPSPLVGAEEVDRVRRAARTRAATVPTRLRVEGPVGLWSHPDVPLLASTALADPARMAAQLAERGLPVPDLHVVVTPGRPLACAAAGVAARLAEASGEPCVRLPWSDFPRLPWT